MSHAHPEQEAEQAYINHAYERLDAIRADAIKRAQTHMAEPTKMFGQQYDRDVSVRVALYRAQSLDIGDESIIFGRTDSDSSEDRFYIGRRAVPGEQNEPLVIDWRVPAAEPFYRATGADPMGLALRRHFLCEGRTLLAIEDEHFGDGTDLGLAGSGALLAALERPRSGTMRDIAATIRAEQDRIIRAPLEGVLAVQGGPGTGKTAVALHRAAFLLFTHRRKLGRQGILVIGPNRLFLRYIDRVLPALGESGARLAMLEDLVDGVTARSEDTIAAARIKGDPRMVKVLERAVRDRQRSGHRDIKAEIDGYELLLPANEVHDAVVRVRRSRRTHNARHTQLRGNLASRLYDRYLQAVKQEQGPAAGLATIARKPGEATLRNDPSLGDALDDIWPLLTPKRLISELYISSKRLESATRGILSRHEAMALQRAEANAWTAGDVPLLDEASVLLGATERDRAPGQDDEDIDEVTTYGHVVVDEVQDMTPMALRMIARRARHGSMTLVGDLAQSIGPLPPKTWSEILEHLPQRAGSHVAELTINYRTPGSIMDVAARVLKLTGTVLEPPESVREAGEPIVYVRGIESVGTLADAHREDGRGTMCMITPPSMIEVISAAAHATNDISEAVSVLGVEDAKGLEFDEVVVIEPALLIQESPQGLSSLYVALTRATNRVRIVHERELPAPLSSV
ncbi:MAG: HelD family protein [Actinomycetota bacterium]